MVPADEPAVTVDLACENRLEPVGTPTARPLYHDHAANLPAFRTAYCQKHVDAEDLYGTVRRRGGDILKLKHPSRVATSSPLGGKGRCSAAVGEGAGVETALECLLLMTSSWPTTGVGRNLEMTKDSNEIRKENDQVLRMSSIQNIN